MRKIFITVLFFFIIAFSFAQQPNFQWVNQLGGSSGDEGRDIAVDASGNVYITGLYNGDVISKFNASGTLIWSKNSTGYISNSIAVDFNGNVYITGKFSGTIDFDPGPGVYNLSSPATSIFISKLDAAGNFVWAKSVGGSFFNTDMGKAITTDASGNAYITGTFFGVVDFDPGPGTYTLSSPLQSTNFEVFILKLDAQAILYWQKI